MDFLARLAPGLAIYALNRDAFAAGLRVGVALGDHAGEQDLAELAGELLEQPVTRRER